MRCFEHTKDNGIMKRFSMSNINILISLPIGILGFLFLFWRRLKEDYPGDQIFTFGFIVAACILVGFFSGLAIYNIRHTIFFSSHGLWFWLAFLFGGIGFVTSFLKLKLRFFETLEATGLGFLFLYFVISLVGSIQTVDLKLLLFSLIDGSLILFFFFIDTRYKRFSWYKSGKVGFAGLMVLGSFFLARAIVALLDPSMLSFVGKFDAIISSVVSFLFFITLYNLSEQ